MEGGQGAELTGEDGQEINTGGGAMRWTPGGETMTAAETCDVIIRFFLLKL